MKKSKVLFFCMLFFCFALYGTGQKVCAGEINASESTVISAASGTFTYEGSTYKAYPEYLQQLREYFSRDDVDLSPSEVSGLISDMNASVKEGIDSGYLYKVSGPVSSAENQENTQLKAEETENSKSTKKRFNIEQSIKENKIFFSDSETQNTTSVEMVIKNTGYNISNLLYIGIGLMALLLLSLFVAIRYDLFAPADES